MPIVPGGLGTLIKGEAVRAAGAAAGAAGGADDVIRIRHYTNSKGLQGIREAGTIRALDENRVFAESAGLKPLSNIEAQNTYGLKPGRGRNFVETDVSKSQVSQRYNPRTGAKELVVKGDVPLRNPTFTERK